MAGSHRADETAINLYHAVVHRKHQPLFSRELFTARITDTSVGGCADDAAERGRGSFELHFHLILSMSQRCHGHCIRPTCSACWTNARSSLPFLAMSRKGFLLKIYCNTDGKLVLRACLRVLPRCNIKIKWKRKPWLMQHLSISPQDFGVNRRRSRPVLELSYLTLIT